MKQCPVCKNYTIQDDYDICEVCFWEYDKVAQKYPNEIIGANNVSLKQAINNYKEGGQIGGDIFKNSDKVLPDKKGRTWREADVGLTGNMARRKQPGTRLLYSNDGLVYVTTDHYKTAHYVCNYK
ncbi:hypothetical protein HCJ58_14985 [Listeria sp. FSL L7-1509]|uniref:Cysteine-rich CPCC domain-containing protein n=1 Tax=Listeria immobilis TaxID=2713502 RepID=A0ABR6T016_9LIST|nr:MULTISPECIES: CPCC family cysteine-rich protein [Listeria]MBC1484516.1 hypothetical protein [Listeria immobilis]MBC1508257.1 hypothetical protein [Listeria immobilis]MBC1511255.1 hypothetical protein [Listeria immobilis]MBC1839518.1 hypothetical protein [Listeria seeligeri]MBC6313692.1 hypothetical protein [Listeria immobilis]